MTGTEIYKRTAFYEREATKLRLHAPQWRLLLAFDGSRTLAEVALNAEVTFAEALTWTEPYLLAGYLGEQPISLEQYLKRAGATDIASIGAAVPPSVVLYAPSAEGGMTTSLESKMDVGNRPDATHPVAMRLAEVVEFLVGVAKQGPAAHFLVYRVFLRVPSHLLEEEEIGSIQLVNESRWVRGRALQEAIAGAVREVAQVTLPESVYAPA